MRSVSGILILLLVNSLISALYGCARDRVTPAPTPTVTPTTAPSPTPVPAAPDPFEQNERLGRGVNMGNALEAPREGAWGVTLQEEYFQLAKKAGFNSVRIPVRWSSHAGSNPPYTIDQSFFKRVDWAVEQALSRGLLVVINMHHYEEIFKEPAEHRERFLALWEQIAEHYRDYPPELLFELLNEPHDMLVSNLWNGLLKDTIKVIRQTNPTRTLIIGPAQWNSIGALPNLELPEDDRNIIVTVHYYEPFRFTHQGAEWVEGSEPWLGTTWEGTPAQQQAVMRDLDQAASWGKAHERPIYLGEFGAYSKADMESRARWTAFVARQAEERGMSWAYWEFCAGFGVFDRSRGAWNEPLLRALIPQQ